MCVGWMGAHCVRRVGGGTLSVWLRMWVGGWGTLCVYVGGVGAHCVAAYVGGWIGGYCVIV